MRSGQQSKLSIKYLELTTLMVSLVIMSPELFCKTTCALKGFQNNIKNNILALVQG